MLSDIFVHQQINDAIIEDAVRRKPDLVVLNYYGEMFVHQQHKQETNPVAFADSFADSFC